METIEHDWHLREWANHLGKRQADLVKDLGWDKAKTNFIWHGKQPYRRDLVAQVSAYFEIEPFELLMPPTEALALRRLRETAHLIAAEDRGREWVPAQPGEPGARKASR